MVRRCAGRKSASGKPVCPDICCTKVGITSCPGAKSLKGRSLSPRIRSHGRGRRVVAQTVSGAQKMSKLGTSSEAGRDDRMQCYCAVLFASRGLSQAVEKAVWVAVDVRLSKPEGQSRPLLAPIRAYVIHRYGISDIQQTQLMQCVDNEKTTYNFSFFPF